METKTEQRSASAEASTVTETVKSTAAMNELPVRSSESLSAEKTPKSRRSPRTTGRKKSTTTTEKALEATSESLPEAAVKTTTENERLMEVPVSSEEASAPTEEKKKPTARKAAKTSAKSVKKESVSSEKAFGEADKLTVETSDEQKPESSEKESKRNTKRVPEKKATAKVKTTEKTNAPEKEPELMGIPEAEASHVEAKELENEEQKIEKKSARTTKKAVSKTEKSGRSDKATTEKSKKSSAEKPEKKEPQKATEKSAKSLIEEKLEAMAKKAKKAKEPEEATTTVEQLTAMIPVASPMEAPEAEPLVAENHPESKDVKASTKKISEEPEKDEMENKESTAFASSFVQAVTEEAVDVSGTPHDTFVFYSPSQLAVMQAEAERKKAIGEVSTEEVKPVEDEILPTAASDVTGRTSEKVEINVTDEGTKPPVNEPKAETPGRSERRAPSQRRSDPHEREVMDKELVRTNLFTVLGNAAELERRILIEETMRTIPLTDEERRDNHPTSLSNRVRSVIGSVLAEELAHGTILVSGRKLMLPKKEEKPTEEAADELLDELPEESVSTDTSKREATLDIEIEFESELEDEGVVEEKKAESSVSVDEDGEDEPFEDDMRTRAPAETSVRTVDTIVAPAPVGVRETSIRRTRQSRSDRRASQAQGTSAVLITEEELERVMLNAVRRNSATKADLLAALKRTYVDPNRFSKDEENRIYTVAGNVLQKLVNRGTLQNNDGRYLQKPSQRVLNPGRAPGASFTGNVETRFITELNRQSGDFFEQFAARLLEKYFEMSHIRVDASYVVGGSDDNGIDIMLETTDWLGYKERVFVQAKKRATQPVTLKEVREFYGALCAEEGTRGVFITTSSFCMEASKMIGKIRNLIAIDKRKLFALAEHCEVGLVRDEEGRLLLDENLFLDYDV